MLARLGITSCVVVGHSMGAQFAVELALQQPPLVTHLVLIGPVVDSRRTVGSTRCRAAGTLAQSRVGDCAVGRGDLNAIRPPGEYVRRSGHARPRDPIAGRQWCEQLAAQAPSARFAEVAADTTSCRRAIRGRCSRSSGGSSRSPQSSATDEHGAPARWLAEDSSRRWQLRSLASRWRRALPGVRRSVVVIPGIYEPWHFMEPLVLALHEAGHPVHVCPPPYTGARCSRCVAEYLRGS